MKKYILFLSLVVAMNNSFAQTTVDGDISQLKNEISTLKHQFGNQKSIISNQQRKINSLQLDFNKSRIEIDSLQNQIDILTNALSSAERKLGSDISKTNLSIENNTASLQESISTKSIFGTIIVLIIALLAGIGLFLLRKKVSNSESAIDKVKDAQKRLEEESVRLDNQLVDILNNQINAQVVQTPPSNSQSTTPDHSLALKVADEIVRIETNISRMDPSVKGLSQLSKAVERIKDNFAAKGYIIADMLGKPYDEGMKIVADFVFDDTLIEGQRIISKVIKPQIIYNGQMIQAAQVTVKQNI